MENESFYDYIRKRFNNNPPINWKLRNYFRSRQLWLRIHNLSGLKRYPENEGERIELLKRQNEVIDKIIGGNNSFTMFISEYCSEKQLNQKTRLDFKIDQTSFKILKPIPLLPFDKDYFDKDDYLVAAIMKMKWFSKSLDDFLFDISLNGGNVLLIKEDPLTILCPYDGGIDILFGRIEDKQYYEKIFSKWLSTREDGM